MMLRPWSASASAPALAALTLLLISAPLATYSVCIADYCICTITLNGTDAAGATPTCPTWIASVYDQSVIDDNCLLTPTSGQILCIGTGTNAVGYGTCSADNVAGVYEFSSLGLNFTDGTLIASYDNVANLAPSCTPDPPFTFAPTQAPTDPPAPGVTPSPAPTSAAVTTVSSNVLMMMMMAGLAALFVML